MNTIEKIDYGILSIETIIIIFGDEMTYNELNKIKNKYETIDLLIEYNRNSKTQLVRVYFNNNEVMDKKYDINHSCDMFYHLSELESRIDN
jgi:hypothetical protein